MKTTQLLLGLLLLSFCSFGQTIIPQKSDSVNKKAKLQYFGDEKEEIAAPAQTSVPEPEQSTKVDTVTTAPVVIKYYQATESYEPQEEKKPTKDKNQIKTLTGKMNHSGGYGAVSFKTSDFKDEPLVMAGVRGAWIINRTLAIGIDAYGIIPTTKYKNINESEPQEEMRLFGGYGGLMLEPIFFSNEVVHITFPISAGAGWLGYGTYYEDNYFENTDNVYDEDVFWYVEPGANLEINIARNFRLDLGVSKRFTQDLQLVNTETDEFDEVNYYITLKIGGF